MDPMGAKFQKATPPRNRSWKFSIFSWIFLSMVLTKLHLRFLNFENWNLYERDNAAKAFFLFICSALRKPVCQCCQQHLTLFQLCVSGESCKTMPMLPRLPHLLCSYSFNKAFRPMPSIGCLLGMHDDHWQLGWSNGQRMTATIHMPQR